LSPKEVRQPAAHVRCGLSTRSWDPSNHTGSKRETSHRPLTLSNATRMTGWVSVGAPSPMVTVWLTNNRTTAWLADTETGAAAFTFATADMCFSFAPGITTSRVSVVYASLKSRVSRSRAAPRSLSTESGLYDNRATASSPATRTDSVRASARSSAEPTTHLK